MTSRVATPFHQETIDTHNQLNLQLRRRAFWINLLTLHWHLLKSDLEIISFYKTLFKKSKKK